MYKPDKKAMEVIKAENDKRSKLIKKFMSSEDMSMMERTNALQELEDRKDFDKIEEYIYKHLFDFNKPSTNVIRMLRQNFKLSDLASTYLVNEMLKQTTRSLNLASEFTKTLHLIDKNIGAINEAMQRYTDGEDLDIDFQVCMQEMRGWVQVKTSMLNSALAGQALLYKEKLNNEVAVETEDVSLEDLQAQLKSLEEG
jgi:hypothetical protein